jgi:hypothetical protein
MTRRVAGSSVRSNTPPTDGSKMRTTKGRMLSF